MTANLLSIDQLYFFLHVQNKHSLRKLRFRLAKMLNFNFSTLLSALCAPIQVCSKFEHICFEKIQVKVIATNFPLIIPKLRIILRNYDTESRPDQLQSSQKVVSEPKKSSDRQQQQQKRLGA